MQPPDAVVLLLTAFLSNDNSQRHEAEAAYENLKTTSPDYVVEQLSGLLCHDQREQIRSLASVLMRNLFNRKSDVWLRISEQTRFAVRQALLHSLGHEPVRHIRVKIAHTIGQVADASMECEEQQQQQQQKQGAALSPWPELMALTVSLCSQPTDNPQHRETGLLLVDVLAEYAGDVLKPHAQELLMVFDKSLEDPDINVRMAGLKATCSFLQELSSDGQSITACSPLVPKMLNVVGVVLNAQREELAQDALSALTTIAERQPRLLRSSLKQISHAMLTLAQSTQLEVGTREVALEFLVTFCEKAPAVVRKDPTVVSSMIPIMLDMLCQLEDEDDDEEAEEYGGGGGRGLGEAWARKADFHLMSGGDGEEGDGEELSDIAEMAFDRIATAIGGQVVVQVALPIITQFLGDQTDWKKRRSALIALTLLTEGCREEIGELLDQIVPPILQFANDVHARVRWHFLSCLYAICLLHAERGADSLHEKFHTEILTVLISSLHGVNEGMPRIQSLAASALTAFCAPPNCTTRHIGALRGDLMRALFASLQQPPPPSLYQQQHRQQQQQHYVVMEEVLSCIGTLSNVLGSAFTEYYPEAISLCKAILSASNAAGGGGGDDVSNQDAQEGLAMLKGKAIECIALVGLAVGKDVFRQDALELMGLLQGMIGDASSSVIINQSHLAMGAARIAGVLGAEFAPYLGAVLPPLFRTISTAPQYKVYDDDGGLSSKEDVQAQLQQDGLTGIACEIRGLGTQVFGLNTTAMQEKEVACRTLLQYARDMDVYMFPFAADATKAVLANLAQGKINPESIRVISAATLPILIDLSAKAAFISAKQEGGGGGDMQRAQATAAVAHDIFIASIKGLMEMVAAEAASAAAGGGGAAVTATDVGSAAAFALGGGGDGEDLEPLCVAANSLTDIFKMARNSSVTGASREDFGRIQLQVPDEFLNPVVVCFRDLATASMERSNQRAKLAREDDCLDEAAMEEAETWEDDLMTSVVDGIGWLIKAKGPAMLPVFNDLLAGWVTPLLTPSSSSSSSSSSGSKKANNSNKKKKGKKKIAAAAVEVQDISKEVMDSRRTFALCMCIDVIEHCGPESGRLVPSLLKLMVPWLSDDSAGVRQAAAYGVGAVAEHHMQLLGSGGGSTIGQALQGLLGIVQAAGEDDEEEDENRSVTENAVSAALKILIYGAHYLQGLRINAVEMTGSLLSYLPLHDDLAEAHDCHGMIIRLAEANHPTLIGPAGENLVPLLVALLQCFIYQPSEEEEIEAEDDQDNGDDGEARGGFSFCKAAAAGKLKKESKDDVWARQLVSERSRRQLEVLLQKMQSTYHAQLAEAANNLDIDQNELTVSTNVLIARKCK